MSIRSGITNFGPPP